MHSSPIDNEWVVSTHLEFFGEAASEITGTTQNGQGTRQTRCQLCHQFLLLEVVGSSSLTMMPPPTPSFTTLPTQFLKPFSMSYTRWYTRPIKAPHMLIRDSEAACIMRNGPFFRNHSHPLINNAGAFFGDRSLRKALGYCDILYYH